MSTQAGSNLNILTKKATDLANMLLDENTAPCSDKQGDKSCTQRQAESKPTLAMRQRGLTKVPFDHYDTDRMCLLCRAHWHASMAQNALLMARSIQDRYGR